MKQWIVGLCSLVLVSCGAVETKAPVDERQGPEASVGQPPATAASKPSGAVNSLILAANRHSSQGDLARAVATLERALRIDPRNARVWYQLAKLRLQQKRYRQAESMALRSNAYAGNRHALKAANWRLIAQSRYARRDFSGADRAIARARALDAAGSQQ